MLTYYMLLQSKPGRWRRGARPTSRTCATPQTMKAYWNDVRLLFQRVQRREAGRRPRRARPLGLPRAGERRSTLASAFAQQWVKLRDRARAERDPRVPHERLGDEARHRLRGSARRDRARVRARSRRRSTGRCTRGFDVAFEDFSDRDAGFYEKVKGNPNTWFKPADFHRHLLYGADVRAARRRAHGRLADPARQHADARDEQHVGPLPGQPRAVAARRRRPRAPARVRRAPASSASCSAAAPTARRAPATRRRTASRTRRRSTATRVRRCRPTTTAATSRRRRAATTEPCATASAMSSDRRRVPRRLDHRGLAATGTRARRIGNPSGPVGALGGAARSRARLAQLRHLGRANRRDRCAARRAGSAAPTCWSCRAASTTSRRAARSRRPPRTCERWSSAASRSGCGSSSCDVLPWNNGWPGAEAPIRELNARDRARSASRCFPSTTRSRTRPPRRMKPEWTHADGDHPSIAGYRRLGELAFSLPSRSDPGLTRV